MARGTETKPNPFFFATVSFSAHQLAGPYRLPDAHLSPYIHLASRHHNVCQFDDDPPGSERSFDPPLGNSYVDAMFRRIVYVHLPRIGPFFPGQFRDDVRRHFDPGKAIAFTRDLGDVFQDGFLSLLCFLFRDLMSWPQANVRQRLTWIDPYLRQLDTKMQLRPYRVYPDRWDHPESTSLL
nr:hypothetical protein [Bacillota bacterium]